MVDESTERVQADALPAAFRSADRPRELSDSDLARRSAWLTWSSRTRRFLRELGRVAPSLPVPTLVQRRRGPGDVTYELPPACLPSSLAAGLTELAAGLGSLRLPRSRMVFLREMLDEHIDGITVHVALALLCTVLRRGHTRYAPILAVPAHRSGFPLHADLFQAPTLLTILDRVPRDGSGACLLAPTAPLLAAIAKGHLLPVAVRRRLAPTLVTRTGPDRYDELVDLFHGVHPWALSMRELLQAHEIAVPLRRGEGYIIDDRCWLHGRRPQSRVDGQLVGA